MPTKSLTSAQLTNNKLWLSTPEKFPIRNEIVIALVCQLWTCLAPTHILAHWAVKKALKVASAGEVSTLQMTLFCFVL